MNSNSETQEKFTKTKLEERGTEYKIGAPITASITLNKYIAVAFGDGTLRFFRPNESPKIVKAHNGVILCIAKKGTNVLTGGDDGRFLEVSSDGYIREIHNFGTQWVDAVASQNDNYACSSGKVAYIWSNNQSKPKLFDNPSTVGGLSFDNTGNKLAVSSYGGVTVWQSGDRRWKSTRFVWKGSHGKVTFSPDGKYLVSTMQENEVHGWRIRDKVDLAMSGYPAKIKSFAWVGNLPYLVTSGASEAICWPFDGKEGPLGRTPICVANGGKQHSTYVESLTGENAIFIGFKDGSVLLSEIDETKQSYLVRNPTGAEISAISISAKKSFILIGDTKGNILWSPLWADNL